jgi:hypothetical protein
MKSATRGNKLFATNPSVNRPRSTFTRHSDLKTTMYSGVLVPVYWDETLPGDTFNVSATFFGRMATPLVPIMDNAYLETFWFYCPNRLLWDNFKKQQGEQTNPGDSTSFLTPIINNFAAGASTVHSLYDYFGHPMTLTTFTTPPVLTSLHLRMYNKTWNEWFRDQDLQNSVTVPTGDGPDDYAATYSILRINKYHDYFTSSRPQPQKGPAVQIPIGGTAAVTSLGTAVTMVTNTLAPTFSGAVATNSTIRNSVQDTNKGLSTSVATGTPGSQNLVFGNQTGVQLPLSTSIGTANLSGATGATLNQFRELVVVQRVYEADMRGGTRYNEGIYVHFGVVNPDNRVNRVLFLGSGKSPVNIYQVEQTSESSATSPQGNLAAYGTLNAHGNGFYQSFSEHGIVFGLAAVRADLHYQQNVEKMFSRRTRFDYYTPEFANLGEQAVLNQEINFTGNSATDTAALSYQERWAEYRYKTSQITGLMRSIWPTSLDVWHLAQDFGGVTPALGNSFVQENAPWNRVVAVTDEPTFILNGYVRNNTTRVMPIRSIPGLTRI